MKKKIAIVNSHMKIGGIASSLQNWARYFSEKEELEIDYYIFDKEFDDKYIDFDKSYNVIYPPFPEKYLYRSNKSIISNNLLKVLQKTGVLNIIKYKFTNNYKVKKKYDLAISFSNDIPRFNNNLMCNDFVENSIDAEFKVAWIHNNIEKLGFNKQYAINRYNEFDAIVNVSKACKDQFDQLVPEYKEKSLIISNAIDIEYITSKSYENADVIFNKNIINFVTVARIYNEQKRIDRVLDVVEKLKNDNLQFHWYIVGDGNDLDWLLKSSVIRGLESHLTFLGFKDNPYPYIKMADYFVLTSDYEAQGMVITEALCIGKPVISTNFEAAKEFIIDGQNGYILEKSNSAFYNLLKDLIISKKVFEQNEFRYNNYQEEFEGLMRFLDK